MPAIRSSYSVLLLISGLVGCMPGGLGQSAARAPTLNGSSLCQRGRINTSPLVVEWSNSERAQFEALAKDGLIVARYTGCELEVLTQCRAPGGYRYTALTPKSELERIEGKDELYAKLPLGAVDLEAQLRRSGAIRVDSTVTGRYGAERVDIREQDLVGRCLGATHIVSGLTVGAFELSSGSDSRVSGEASTLRFGSAHGSSSSEHTVLSHAGDARACFGPSPAPARAPAPADVAGTQPEADGGVPSPPIAAPLAPVAPPPVGAPAGCDALIRLDLAPLPEAEAREAAARTQREREIEDQRRVAKTRRTIGYTATTAGVASLVLSGLFAYWGSRQNSKIQAGGFPTSQDLEAAEATGKRDNTLGWAFGVGGGLLVGAGVPLILLSPSPPSVEDASAGRTPKVH